jgi:hypothetical protein
MVSNVFKTSTNNNYYLIVSRLASFNLSPQHEGKNPFILEVNDLNFCLQVATGLEFDSC